MSDEQRAASTSPSSVSRLASVSEPAALAATSGARVGVSHETRQAAARAEHPLEQDAGGQRLLGQGRLELGQVAVGDLADRQRCLERLAVTAEVEQAAVVAASATTTPERPVTCRASWTAIIVASVPELVNRSWSMAGNRPVISSASRSSSSWVAPIDQPRSRRARTASATGSGEWPSSPAVKSPSRSR